VAATGSFYCVGHRNRDSEVTCSSLRRRESLGDRLNEPASGLPVLNSGHPETRGADDVLANSAGYGLNLVF
jgi:hypothetical protein